MSRDEHSGWPRISVGSGRIRSRDVAPLRAATYSIGRDDVVPEFAKRLEAMLPMRTEGVRESDVTLLDTFDWRLFERGLFLLLEDGTYHLWDSKEDDEVDTLENVGHLGIGFWWDLPESSLRDHLRRRIGIRALMPLVRFHKSSRHLRLLNEAQTRALSISFDTYTAAGGSGQPPFRLCVCQLRSQKRHRLEHKAAKRLLAGLGIEKVSEHPLVSVLSASGFAPGKYSSRPHLSLEPDMPARTAARKILSALVRTMQQNEDGIRRDIDTEFLHDFRISVRRARSLVSLLHGVLEPSTTSSLKTDLRTLGSWSNELRDLDVYLLDRDYYEDMLPAELRPGIAILFRALKRKRRRTWKKLVTTMDSRDYRQIMERLDAVVSNDARDTIAGENGGIPISLVARRLIFKRYRKIVKAGSRIDTASPDTELHRLRIECKKLRYSLEFFESLFPRKDIKVLLQHLKRLQKNLGRFNDLSVQQDFLHANLDSIRPGSRDAIRKAAAIGGLIARLNEQQQRVKLQFLDVFAHFHAGTNSSRYIKLFK